MNNSQKTSKYKYTEGERETLRVLKMQENDLSHLEADISSTSEELQNLRKRITVLAGNFGVDVSSRHNNNISSLLRIREEEIPSWDELVSRANKEVDYDVVIEDLLSREEFNYCIADVERINNEFSQKTSIWDKRDLSCLALATGLRTARWIILQLIMGDLGADKRREREDNKTGDKRKKKENDDYVKRHDNRENVKSQNEYPTWRDIVFGQYKRTDGGKSWGVCPYDAQNGGPEGFEDGNRGSHRVHTLGHDPLLGWIFGTANLMTCSISLSKKFKFANHHVTYPYGVFGDKSYLEMFSDVFKSIKEDKYRLAAALFAQGAHLRSDIHTSKGLPLPLVEVFTKELAGKLYSEQYDTLCLMKDLKKSDFKQHSPFS